MKEVLYVGKQTNISTRIRRLEIVAVIFFICSAVFCAFVIDQILESAKRDSMMQESYFNSVALSDSANKLVIANALRWKAKQDSKDSLEAVKK